MSDLILYIVKSLVTNPDAVSVDEQRDGGEVNLVLTVDPADMGLVIGKSGQTIKAIRKVLIVKAMAENVRVNLQLAEPEGGFRKSEDQSTGEPAEVSESADQSVSDTETPEDGNTDQADTAETTDQTDNPISSDLSKEPQESDSNEESESK